MKTIKLNSLSINSSQINSASSLINIKNRIFACCDDQYALYEFKEDCNWIQHSWKEAPLLPLDPIERKKIKPDFEALLGPVINGHSLLVIPSGSKKNRIKALVFDLVSNQFSLLDLSNLFNNLIKKIELINIEGAVIFEDKYYFMNRGVREKHSSLVCLNPFTSAVDSVSEIDFGLVNGVNLHGSELCFFDSFLYVLAVAENTSNSYDDGKIVGSALFKLTCKSYNKFIIIDRWDFDKPVKLEGLCRWNDSWLVATDPDGSGLSEFFNFKI